MQPKEFGESYGSLRRAIVSYTKNVTSPRALAFIPLLQSALQEISESVMPGITCEALAMQPKQCMQAALMSSLATELFRYFGDDTFDAVSSHLPTGATWEQRNVRRHDFAKQVHEMSRLSSVQLLEMDPLFRAWTDDLKARLKQRWCAGDEEIFTALFLT